MKKVARKFCEWTLKSYAEDHEGAYHGEQHQLKPSLKYDLTWHDNSISPKFFSMLETYQKVNMYPGIQCITKKNLLARNLMQMAKAFPNQYEFFPKTWLLPS